VTTRAAAARDFGRAIRRTPIGVNDTRGFYAPRCVLTTLRERAQLISSKALPAAMNRECGRGDGGANARSGPLSLNMKYCAGIRLENSQSHGSGSWDPAVDPRQKQLLAKLVETRGRLAAEWQAFSNDYQANGTATAV